MRICITPAYKPELPDYIKESHQYFETTNGCFDGTVVALCFDVEFTYNGESLNSQSVTRDSISVSRPDADGFVEVTFTMGTTITGDTNYAKAQIDLQAAIDEIPASITVQPVQQYKPATRERLDENIIIIAPLN